MRIPGVARQQWIPDRQVITARLQAFWAARKVDEGVHSCRVLDKRLDRFGTLRGCGEEVFAHKR